ncbi:MAG: CsgG/HfaB family protein [Hydrogenophilaceae bacterium]
MHNDYARIMNTALALLLAGLLGGCAGVGDGPATLSSAGAKLTPVSKTHRDLVNLPEPKGKIVAAVYSFRDQTGQYKPSPDSSFSTAVTQGAASILVRALKDSNWFLPVERESLQSLLTERKVIRAGLSAQEANQALPNLLPASILLEGGIVAYESNVKTGGVGARYLGIGASTLYRMDQVTVTLRAVDIRTGRVLNAVSTTKTIFSHQVDLSIFRFVKQDKLFELEAGYSRNEPAQLCVSDAIEAALIHLIVQGLQDSSWALKDAQQMTSPLLQAYLEEQRNLLVEPVPEPEATSGSDART